MYDTRSISIHGVPVQLRRLPSGDWAVWHPLNESVRALVEPICRGLGYWHGEYHNWIVFSQFADQVWVDLLAAGHAGGQ